MLLKCPNCAGNVTATDDGLRGGEMVCDYCQTSFRITESDSAAYKHMILRDGPPSTVKLERRGSSLTIQILNGRSVRPEKGKLLSPNHVGLSLFCCILLGISTHFLYGDSIPLGVIYGVVVPLLFFVSFFFLPHSLPAIELTEKWLKIPPAIGIRSGRIDRAAIRQLFVTINELEHDGERSRVISLIALTKNERRIPISSEFSTFVEAIYAEALLEKELGIFDLPVFGEVDSDVKTAVSRPSHPPIEKSCFSCAAPLTILASEQQQGYTTCKACLTVTLLYSADGDRLILGQPNPSKTAFQLITKGNHATIMPQESDLVMLGFAGRTITDCIVTPRLRREWVEQLSIVEANREKSQLGDLLSGKIAKRYEDLITYSNKQEIEGDEKEELLEAVLSVATYHIVGKVNGQNEILLPELSDIQEAAFLVERLTRFLQTKPQPR